MSALTKSARTYHKLVRQLPDLTGSNSVRGSAYQEAAKYLRALYHEHGRENVRRELRRVS